MSLFKLTENNLYSFISALYMNSPPYVRASVLFSTPLIKFHNIKSTACCLKMERTPSCHLALCFFSNLKFLSILSYPIMEKNLKKNIYIIYTDIYTHTHITESL